jgi:hypothetical protein
VWRGQHCSSVPLLRGISKVYYNTTPDERPANLIDYIRHARVS